MTHHKNILKFITELKNDKAANPKWRNKLVARAEEIEAMIGKLEAHEITKSEAESLDDSGSECTCAFGAVSVACPLHGSTV